MSFTSAAHSGIPTKTFPDQSESVPGTLASNVSTPASLAREDTDRNMCSHGLPSREGPLAKAPLLPSSTGQGKKFLGDLCDDLWNCILDFIPCRPWLYDVLRLSKRFHKLVLPRLYRSISYHFGFPQRGFIQALFDVDNPGLQYIRELTLTPSMEDSMASDLMVSMFIRLLPKDVLRYFCWNGRETMVESTFISLWERQRNLSNIEFLPEAKLDGVITRRPAILKSLKSLRSLRLVPDTFSQWKAAATVLKSDNIIHTLILDLWYADHEDRTQEDGDAGVYSRTLETKKLFSLFAATPLSLTKLELHNVTLHNSTRAIISGLRLATLRDLNLYICKGADIFLTSLSRTKNPPRLRALRVNNPQSETSDIIVTAIEDYLTCTPSSLLTLTVILRGSTVLPKASSIVHHGPTLKHLFLDVRFYTGEISHDCDDAALYTGSEVQTFFANLPHVTQLAMAFPKVIADGSGVFEMGEAFKIQYNGMLLLPSLMTLNITTYPFPIGTSTDPNDPLGNFGPRQSVKLAAHNALLLYLATVILEDSRHYRRRRHNSESPLRTVAFGIAEHAHRRSVLQGSKDLRPTYFTKSDVRKWRRRRDWKDIQPVTLRLLALEGREVDVLMERVEDDLDPEEIME